MVNPLTELLAAILGARVEPVAGYTVVCDCVLFTTTQRRAFEVAVKNRPEDGNCDGCGVPLRYYAAYDPERVEHQGGGRSTFTHLIALDPHTLEPIRPEG